MNTEIIRKYVEIINQNINQILQNEFGHTKEDYSEYLHNLCKPIHYHNTGEIIPAEYILPINPTEKTDRNLGNYKNVVFNDKTNFQCYHRLTPSPISQDTEKETITINANILLTIYTKYDSVSILEWISQEIPQVIFDDKNAHNAKIEFTNFSLDEKSIFSQERGNVQYNLNTNWHLLQIGYKLNVTIKKYC